MSSPGSLGSLGCIKGKTPGRLAPSWGGMTGNQLEQCPQLSIGPVFSGRNRVSILDVLPRLKAGSPRRYPIDERV